MEAEIKIVLLTLGIGNGLFLAFSLFRFSQTDRSNASYLAFLLLAFSLLLSTELLDITLQWLVVPVPLVLLIGPLTYLYVQSTINRSRRFPKWMLLHFLPSLASLLFFFGLFLQNLDGWKFDLLKPYVAASSLLQRISLIGYLAVSMFFLLKSRPVIRSENNQDAIILMTWLSSFLVLIAGLVLLSLPRVQAIVGEFEQDMMGSIVIVLLVHTLGFIVISRRKLQDGFTEPRKLAIADDETEELCKKILDWIDTKKPYLDPDFSLDLMSQELEMTRNAISDILNIGMSKNFYDVINRCRVDEFKRLSLLPQNVNSSVLELAFACGFNSKAAFYRAFKTLEGVTPTQFRKNIESI